MKTNTFRKTSTFLTIVFFLVYYNMAFSQDHELSMSGGLLYGPEDFYLGFKAVKDPNIESEYHDGSEASQAERYSFQPLWYGNLIISINFINPREPSRYLSLSTGLGLAGTSYIIERPIAARLKDFGTIVSGNPAKTEFELHYLNIPVGLFKNYEFGSGLIDRLSYGVMLRNLILVQHSSTRTFLDRNVSSETQHPRLIARQGFVTTINGQFGVEKQVAPGVLVGVEGVIGLAPMSLMRFEPSVHANYNLSFEDRGTTAYEETSNFNLMGGFNVSISYQFKQLN